MARIGPVSMSASGRIFAPQDTAKVAAGIFRAVATAACKGAQGFFRGSVEFALGFVVGNAGGAFLEPFLNGFFQERGYRDLAVTGLALEVGLKVARHAPTVDFGLHALQCSAFSILFPPVRPSLRRGSG